MPTVNLDKALKDLGTSTAARTDYRVFMCLAEHMNDEGVSAVPQSLLSEETGFRRRTVSNSVKRLAEKGFLTIERNMTEHGGIATNMYHINPKYLTHAEPVEQSNTETPSRVPETQTTTPGCVNLEKALAELGSDGVNEKAKKIFTLLARHANQNGEARVLLHDITSETHISAKVVKDEIGFLVHQGFLKVSKEFVNTDTAHYYRNVYMINPRFLKTKLQCAACYQGGPHVVPDYLSGWKLVTNDGEHEGVSYASDTTDVQGLARLGIVMADVVKEIFKLYEEKSMK